jgi:uncharacterized protein YbjT (DUF2867 family)
MTILVLGATGHVGGALVDGLLAHGVSVRAVSRSERDWPAGVEGFVGDPNDADGLAGAAAGVTGVFLMSGYAAEQALLAELPDDAHVVLLSASSAGLGEQGNAMGAMHRDSERAVEESGRSWTFLRPCSFQSNLTRWVDQLAEGDVVRAPFADVPTASIDPADIAAVATAVLTEEGHAGVVHRLSGPESLTPVEQLALLSVELDRPLTLDPMDDAEAEEQMGEPYGAAAVQIFREHPDLESDVQPTVERLLGRPPGTLQQWLAAHSSELAPRGR